jgi:chloride channel 3/4/5
MPARLTVAAGASPPRHLPSITSASRWIPHRLSGFSDSVRSPFVADADGHLDGDGEDGDAAAGAVDPDATNGIPAAVEEISEIKRYEDFTTIDWVQDAVHEQARRRAARRARTPGFWDRDGSFAWRRNLRQSYDAANAWLVVTIVGAAIGLNAAFLNIVTEWLSDIKLGHCSTAFYLNEQFCCWGVENGT